MKHNRLITTYIPITLIIGVLVSGAIMVHNHSQRAAKIVTARDVYKQIKEKEGEEVVVKLANSADKNLEAVGEAAQPILFSLRDSKKIENWGIVFPDQAGSDPIFGEAGSWMLFVADTENPKAADILGEVTVLPGDPQDGVKWYTTQTFVGDSVELEDVTIGTKQYGKNLLLVWVAANKDGGDPQNDQQYTTLDSALKKL